jgi:hypothetical protein
LVLIIITASVLIGFDFIILGLSVFLPALSCLVILAFFQDIKTSKDNQSKDNDTNGKELSNSDDPSKKLLKEIQELTTLVERKTREAEQLSLKLKNRRDVKILQRIAQLQLTLEFSRKMMALGKIDAVNALQEVELEFVSALEEIGIKAFPIEPGTKLRELPSGAFELIKAEPLEQPDLAGTVKQVHQSAIIYQDSEGQIHFLIPAKIDAYKLY